MFVSMKLERNKGTYLIWNNHMLKSDCNWRISEFRVEKSGCYLWVLKNDLKNG